MKKMLALAVAASTLSTLSYAEETNKGGLFVEPMVTYERGRGDVNLPGKDAKTELDGFGVGARVGFHVYNSIFLGVDGRYSMPHFKDDKIEQDTSAKAWNVGPVIGFQMPTQLGIRVWAGYIVAGEVAVDKDKNLEERFESGSGYRVGAGVKLGMVSLNLEYQKMTYDETRVLSIGPFNSNDSFDKTELNNDSMILSVSFPIAI